MQAKRGLIDTHTFLWALRSSEKLSRAVRVFLENPETIVFVSVGSLWEIAIKANVGKLHIPEDFFQRVELLPYERLNISLEHLKAYHRLELLHRDPFDRLLLAQAQVERLTLLTRDPEILRYPGVDFIEA